jgi:hypothetical protein
VLVVGPLLLSLFFLPAAICVLVPMELVASIALWYYLDSYRENYRGAARAILLREAEQRAQQADGAGAEPSGDGASRRSQS